MSAASLGSTLPTTGWFFVPGRRSSAMPDQSQPQSSRPLDSGDLRAVAISFGITAGLVLAAALVCDVYLLALLVTGPRTLDDILAFQLAKDLLPWTSVFTGFAVAAIVCGLGIARRA